MSFELQTGLKFISVGLCSIALLGTALGVSKMFSSHLEAIGRNPSAEPLLRKNVLIGAALAEAMGLFGFTIAMILLYGQ